MRGLRNRNRIGLLVDRLRMAWGLSTNQWLLIAASCRRTLMHPYLLMSPEYKPVSGARSSSNSATASNPSPMSIRP